MAEIKAIETIYKGYRFRSRLEARWAVFFDAALIRYEYEQQGYECDGEYYLPDFYLPDLDVHVEVKPDRPGIEKDILKCMKMIKWGGDIKTIIFLGNVPPDSDGGHWHFPALYYQTGRIGEEVRSGWWFFQDAYDDEGEPFGVTGWVSDANYPLPFFESDGKLYGRIYKKNRLKPSVEPVSDRLLKHRDPVEEYKDFDYPKDAYLQWLKDITKERNEMFYSALKMARKARFEHGECG